MTNGPTFPSELSGAQPNIVTFDIDGGKTYVESSRVDTLPPLETSERYHALVEQVGFMANTVRGSGKFIDGLGITIPVGTENGILTQTRKIRKPDWEGAPFVEDIAQETGVPAERIVLLSEHEAGVIAEQTARPDTELGLFLNVGRSFSGGLYSRENLRENALAPKVLPTELGHHFLRHGAQCPCGKHGCIEAFASTYALRRATKQPINGIPEDDRVWNHFKIDLADAVADTLRRSEVQIGKPVTALSIFGTIAINGPDILPSMRSHLLPKLGKSTPEIIQAQYGIKSAIKGARIAVERLLAQ